MFIISIILVFLSSYLLLSVFDNKYLHKTNLLYFFLIIFSQIVLSFEILSLLKIISAKNILICNLFVFLLSIAIFKIKHAKLYKPDVKQEYLNIKKAIIQDKYLKILSISFIVYIISQLLNIFIIPVEFGDALTYYFPRCTHWIQSGTINHYYTFDIRELIMPVNMEFLYTWLFLFTKNISGSAIFSFAAYSNAIYVIYSFLGELGYCRRKRVWSVFIFSAFSIIIAMAVNPLADLFIGSLILSALYLFVLYCKYNKKEHLYMSSLAYALAIGTKTTALISIPATLITCIAFFILYKNKKLFKTLLLFASFFIINTIIFSLYNYILNYIDFGNFLSNNGHILLNQFRGGVKGYLFNLITYFFFIFDMSGIQNIDFYNNFIMNLYNSILNILGLNPSELLSPFYNEAYSFSSKISPYYSALGAVGLFTFYPAIVFWILKKNKTSLKSRLMLFLALLFLFNILVFSRAMFFTKFNSRYLVTFLVISVPIVVCTYIKNNRNLYKLFLFGLMFIYLFVNTFSETFGYVVSYIKFCINNPSIENKYAVFNKSYMESEKLYEYLISLPMNNIAMILSEKQSVSFDIAKLELNGKKIDKILVERLNNYDFKKYDYIVIMNEREQISSYMFYKTYNSKNYIENCRYMNSDKQQIPNKENADLKKSVKVYCDMPFNYIENQGFEKDKKFLSNEYIIFVRKE